ncbi:MAG TPA: 30S ribosomal protein S9 [Candidatus Moranbacteria bacterium]|nr:30S ribosomal protein S9 [Candidatus Moranbacteria bacterium]
MAVKKTSAEKYFEGTGRRKLAIARVRIYPESKQHQIMINQKSLDDYFKSEVIKDKILAPLLAVGMKDKIGLTAVVYGGGKTGQAEAIQLGLSRALVKYEADFQKPLRDLDYLKRDPRRKERKKPGLKKARRAPQWAKR